MKNNLVLDEYSKLGINSQTGLYDYMLSHEKATINSIDYNFKNSNETMEFMASFFGALGFEIRRFYLENDSKRHWFLAFSNGFKWFYYETTLKDIVGKYTFKSYNNLIMFALSKIIKSLENISDSRDNVTELLQGYTLREIQPLSGFDLDENILASKKGKEILVWGSLSKSEDYDEIIKKAKREEIKNRSTIISILAFVVGFILTLGIGVFLVWLLARHYYG